VLSELKNVRQVPGEGFRRWFRDGVFDLIVFYPSRNQEQICGFQLCYRPDKNGEKVFSWNEDGYSHNKIDDGETEPLHSKMSPVFVPDGVFDAQTILPLFLAAARFIDPRITEEVETRIRRFPSPK
jgi:hypothetical protein